MGAGARGADRTAVLKRPLVQSAVPPRRAVHAPWRCSRLGCRWRTARSGGCDGSPSGIGYLGTHVFNGVAFQLPYDVLNDFEPVSLLVANPLLIVSRKTMPVTDLRGLIAWLKANPGKASQGTSGAGGTSDVAG